MAFETTMKTTGGAFSEQKMQIFAGLNKFKRPFVELTIGKDKSLKEEVFTFTSFSEVSEFVSALLKVANFTFNEHEDVR